MSTPGPDFRPCGACAELVPSDTGCPHWKPKAKTGKKMGWVRGRARTATPAASPAADLAFLQVLDRGATSTIQ